MAWHEGWKLLRQEAAFDVLTGRRVQRPVFSKPEPVRKKLLLGKDESAVVNFVLADKMAVETVQVVAAQFPRGKP